MKDLLEVLRVQRHNFLNHLQVISGLLQLKKYDRISEYIKQIGDNYNQDSLVGRLESAEIARAILTAELVLGKQGISIEKTITTNLDKKIVDEQGTAEILKEILVIAGGMTQATDYNSERFVELNVVENGDSYDFQVAVIHSSEVLNPIKLTSSMVEQANQAKCQLSSCSEGSKFVITLKSLISDK